MIKYIIQAECEDEYDRDAFCNAVKNKLLLEGIYNEVFRPIIKYGADEDIVYSYELVWERLSEYLEGN